MVSLPYILAEIPIGSESPFQGIPSVPFGEEITNSFIVTIIVTLFIVLLSRRITKTVEVVPSRRLQNAFEALMVTLYNSLEGIVGKHMIRKCFPLLATIFIFTLMSNWLGLFPGVGTIGFAKGAETMKGPFSLDDHHMIPLFRPVMADLNSTLGMALVFMLMWLVWTFSEVGVGGFVKHTFAPKGGLKGLLYWGLLPIFIFVGLIELVSIAFRPVSLSLRLFGNVYAGENLMHTMQTLGYTFHLNGAVSFILGVILPLPFFFLELLVGVLQALVFTLLCAVYIQLSTAHEEGHDDHHENSHGAPASAGHH